MAATNGDDDRVTMLEMPAGHMPTWGHLVPSNYFEESSSEPPSAAQEDGDDEEVVTMRELRKKYSGSTKDIEPNVRMGECKLYSVTHTVGPDFGFVLVEGFGRICIQGSRVPRDLVGCQVGSILVAINGKPIPHGTAQSAVIQTMARVIENPPVTLHFVDNEDFISYFVAAGKAKMTLWIGSTEQLDTLQATLQLRCNTITSLITLNLSIDGRKLADLASAIVGSDVDKVDLSSNAVGTHEELQYLPGAFGLLKQLKQLNLSWSQIGEVACKALCTCLPDWSNLEVLCLNTNLLNNQCCAMLANALRGNTTIKSLDIAMNPEIDEEGLSNFVQVLRSAETIEGITNSNHQLIIGTSVSRIPPEFERLIRINWSSISANQKVRRKVAMVMFRGGLTRNHLSRMPVGLMPFLIRFMGDKEIEMNRLCPFTAAYHFIRNCDCADLFGFPSVERLLIESLKRENEELRVSAKFKDDTIRALEAKLKELEEADASANKKLRLS